MPCFILSYKKFNHTCTMMQCILTLLQKTDGLYAYHHTPMHTEKSFCLYTEISTVINTYFIAVKWGQSQNNDVIISSKCIEEQRRHAIYLVLNHKQYKYTCLKLGWYITVKREIPYKWDVDTYLVAYIAEKWNNSQQSISTDETALKFYHI